jgi:hypothetical protein
MSSNPIVQYVGFESKPLFREYTFQVRSTDDGLREFTLTIANTAFDSHRVRFQDAPDICSLKLTSELEASANHPLSDHFALTESELETYRSAHTHKSSKYPYAPKPDKTF